MSTEKRAHPRFPLILAVDYPGAASTVRDYTENLSAGGLFIRTERDFEVGDRVTLLISFPELLEPAELEVEVVRMRGGAPGQPAGVAVWIPPDRVDDRRRLEQLSRAAAAAAEAAQPAYRVLLVEDNSLVAAMYTSALRRLAASEGLGGLAVDVAVDGNEAFARLLAQPPIDLVITDVYMPVMSGFALVEKVRAEPRLRHLPIIVISSAGEEERERVSRLGANFFLQKPVKYQDIVTTVRTLLRAGPQPGAPIQSRQAPKEEPRAPIGEGAPGRVDPRRGKEHKGH
ncbi:MAG TPA: response regulator [Anaeromyxobacteraceae bacterium]|nr:response regulator [Anaeromyxobacteraceae bacterium]